MAGSWAAPVYITGSLSGALNKPYGVQKTFTADAADGSIPADEEIVGLSGHLIGVDVVFGTTAPNSLTVALKTHDGITIVTDGPMTTSTRITVSPPVPFSGGLKILCTGNTTNSATAKIIPLVF
jgi:hypothetical protein